MDDKAATGSKDQGIDRRVLRQVRDRFLQSNAVRLERTRASLGTRQEIVVDLLPLLFHVNHPLLPGYVSGATPCDIGQYTPDKQALRIAAQFARSFRYQRKVGTSPELHSIFIMGSAGSIGHSGQSDLDVWVCHQSGLSDSAVAELSRKCALISEWCHARLGLEAHFFPMSPTRFSRGETGNLSTEDCGSAQHFLLLEEFYRTAVLLAGRYPIWWLTPPALEREHELHAERLRRQRFIHTDECIDFGGIPAIPPGEFVGAGLWQIYKGIDSPYKSVLKSLLTEVYASQHPNVETVSLAIKQRIYNKLMDPDELDPYMVVYRRLESYLKERQELERLELIRRCMYIKAGQKLSGAAQRGNTSWRRQIMERLVREWGWGTQQLRDLDQRHRWKASRVSRERREIVNNLTYSYRFLSQFAMENRSTASIDAQEMALLGRKLYASYERRANKVEWLNPGISPDISEPQVTIALSEGTWLLFNAALLESSVSSTPPLKRSRSLVDLLVWCHANRLIGRESLLNVLAGKHRHVLQEARRCLEILDNRMPRLDVQPPQDSYRHAAVPEQALMFINVAMEACGQTSEALGRVSEHQDPLSFSMLRDNLVLTLDLVLRNSWNEIFTFRFQDPPAFAECLLEFIREVCLPETPSGQHYPVECFCFTPGHGASIASRVADVLNELRRTFGHAGAHARLRFLLEIGEQYLLLELKDQTPGYELASTEAELIALLSRPQPHFSPLLLDHHTLKHSALGAVCRTGMTRTVQVFIRDLEEGVYQVYLTDPNGALLHWTGRASSEAQLLLPLRRFLEAVCGRHLAETEHQDNRLMTPEFYRLGAGGDQSPHVSTRLRLPPDTTNAEHHAVQAIAQRGAEGRIGFTVFCNHQEFSALEYGEALFPTVAQHIVNQRSSRARYPCYITDLDLSQLTGSQTEEGLNLALYLQYKQRLEKALADAMQSL